MLSYTRKSNCVPITESILDYIYIGIITEFDASQERAQILDIGILLVQSIRNF